MEEIINMSCSNESIEIFAADPSLTPQPLIEKGTIPIKFKKIEVNKSFILDKLNKVVDPQIPYTNIAL